MRDGSRCVRKGNDEIPRALGMTPNSFAAPICTALGASHLRAKNEECRYEDRGLRFADIIPTLSLLSALNTVGGQIADADLSAAY